MEGGASSFLDGRRGKKPPRTQGSLKIKPTRGAVSSINRAGSEQTALPGAPRGCGAPSSPLPSAHLPALSAPCCQLLRLLLGPQKFIPRPRALPKGPRNLCLHLWVCCFRHENPGRGWGCSPVSVTASTAAWKTDFSLISWTGCFGIEEGHPLSPDLQGREGRCDIHVFQLPFPSQHLFNS